MIRRIRAPWAPGWCYLSLLVAAGGCGILDPQPDVSKFYVLTSRGGGGAAEVNASPGLGRPMVAVGPVRFPDYLNRSQMAVRLSENEVQYSDVHRWAEPLETNFKRVLSQDLAFALGRVDVIIHPYVGRRPVYEVPLEVLRFETDESGMAHLTARWVVRDGKTRAGLYAAESLLTEPAAGPGVQASVAALSAVVTRLSDEIAAAVRQLGSAPQGSPPR
jgi:uncharacterized lipoprotein YmbA